MSSNFELLNKTNKLIDYENYLLVNCPKREVVLRQNLEKAMYEMIRLIFTYNINDTFRIKNKVIKDFLVELSMLDYYSGILLKKKAISKKQYTSVVRLVIEVRKISYGLLKKDKSEEDD